MVSARFDEYEVNRKKKGKMINNLEKEILGLTEKIDKLSSLADRQEQYSRRNFVLIHGVKENQNEDTDEVVITKIKSEVDLEIYSGDINRTHRTCIPSKGKNRPIIVNIVRYMDRRREFTNKKRLKRKNMPVTESLTKIRMTALKKARNKGYSKVWTADGNMMYTDEGDTIRLKFNLIDVMTSRRSVTEKQELFLILMTLFYFYLFGGFFTKHCKTVKLLCLFNTFYKHTTCN